MTEALLVAGVNVLVEKPLAASRGEAERVAAAAERAGRLAAVGFQYLHAPEVRALKELLLAGAIGRIRRIVALAAWPRSHEYYTRNAWAGRLRLDGAPVFDSPINNAMSHFVLVMLYLAGDSRSGGASPRRFRAELYRAQPIESFDTATVQWETADGLRLEFYGTHSTRWIAHPTLRIEGERGTANWMADRGAALQSPPLSWSMPAEPESRTRERMLRDVLDRCAGFDRWVCEPHFAGVHVRCVAALHAHVPIRAIEAGSLLRRSENGENFSFVPDLDEQLTSAADSGRFLNEVGAPWAQPERPEWVLF